MQSKLAKNIGKTSLILFLLGNVFLGYLGISSILLTLSAYIILLLIFLIWARFYIKKIERRKNAILLVATLLISLFAGEVFLKYVLKLNINYAEANGQFFYQSEFKQHKLYNLVRLVKKNNGEIGISNKPNSTKFIKKPDFEFKHQYNKHGFRGKNKEIDSHKFKIVALGDSFTEGVGTTEDSTWLNLLELKLNNDKTQNLQFQCINAGVNGSDPFFEYFTLKNTLEYLRPNIVLLSINRSDLHEIVVRGGMERFKKNGRLKYNSTPWWSSVYQVSFIARAIFHSVGKFERNLLTKRENKVREIKAVEKINKLISNQYGELSRKYNFELVVLLHPVKFELEMSEFSLTELNKKLKKNPRVTTYNLFDDFTNYCSTNSVEYSTIYWPTDLHHNSKGYSIWAEILYNRLKPKIESLNY